MQLAAGKTDPDGTTTGADQVWADEVMATWLWQPDQIRLEDFLANDDQRTGYHLQRWQAEAPAALAELSGRFLDRRLLKATAVEHLSPADQLQLLATARRLADRHGHDPELCCGLRHQQLRGYHPYRCLLYTSPSPRDLSTTRMPSSA